jgi:hypothetical protein
MSERDHNDPFKEGTFFDNLNAGVLALGPDQLPIAFDIARMNFRSTKERDKLLTVLGRMGGSLE